MMQSPERRQRGFCVQRERKDSEYTAEEADGYMGEMLGIQMCIYARKTAVRGELCEINKPYI